MPNSNFIPINKVTPKEIQELGKYHSMISPRKKGKSNRSETTSSWRKPDLNELTWMKDDGNRKYRSVVHR